MIAMQYKILLPDDYDMDVIKKRVALNGQKTDGFQDLIFKAYLISETNHKEYSPLYLWKDHGGMNQFIFNGFYDNILDSFGWQDIKIGIPFLYNLETDFKSSNYVFEIERKIPPTPRMKPLKFSLDSHNCFGKLLIYNPDKWKCLEYYFYKDIPAGYGWKNLKTYRLLHLST